MADRMDDTNSEGSYDDDEDDEDYGECDTIIASKSAAATPTVLDKIPEANMSYLYERLRRNLGFMSTDFPLEKKIPMWKYVKHRYGTDGYPIYVKLLNLDRVRQTIVARKWMSMNFLYENTRKRGISKPQYPYTWYDRLNSIHQATNISKKYIKMKKSISRSSAHAHHQRVVKEEIGSSTRTQTQKSSGIDFYNVLNSKAMVYGPFGTPTEATFKKNSCRDFAQKQYDQVYLKKEKSCPKQNEIEEQEINFKILKKLQSIVKSTEVREVMLNHYVAEINTHKKPYRGRLNMQKNYMITLRRGIYTHDWALVSKCCEGLIAERPKSFFNNVCKWPIWNGGFLALVNLYKNDTAIVTQTAELMRHTLSAYPRRLGIDVGTWLTQKGFFSKAFRLLEEGHASIRPVGTYKRIWFDNARMNQINFIAELFIAVNHYSIYKRNLILEESNIFMGDGQELNRLGEFALSLFELLERRGDAIENDSTIFIEKLIELKVSIQGLDVAKEKFKEKCANHYNNGVLRELYLKFLLQYFPSAEEEIQQQRTILEKFDFTVPLETKASHRAKFAKFTNKLPQVCSFKKLKNPGFSW